MAGAAVIGRRVSDYSGIDPNYLGSRLTEATALLKSVGFHRAVPSEWLRHRALQIAGFIMLFGLPWAVAVGTQNHLLFPGSQVVASWKVLVLIPMAALWSHPRIRLLGFGIGLLSLLATQTQFLDGYVFRPYRLATTLWAQSVPVPDLPRGKTLLFDVRTAEFLAALAPAIASQSAGENPPIMAFFDCPGIVYLVGGRSPGTPWYFSPQRMPGFTAAMLQRWANSGQKPLHSRRPLILLDQQLDHQILGVLHEIGIDFPSAYREIGVFPLPLGNGVIHLWAPHDLHSGLQPRPPCRL
jgi:hypothetical protein